MVPVFSGVAFLTGLVLEWAGLEVPALVLFWIGLLLGASTFTPGAIRKLFKGKLGIGLLMTISAVGAVILGYVEEAAALAFLYSIAEALEDKAMDRARGGLRALLKLVPETATIRQDGAPVEVAAKDLAVGQLMLVRPGERIATDGIVRTGRSSLDTSAITGESIPVEVEPGDAVSAGAINTAGALEVETTAAGTDVEDIDGGRLVRERREVSAEVHIAIEADGPVHRVSVTVRNTGPAPTGKDDAIARSLIGTHVIAATDGAFVSLLEPPDDARAAVDRCERHRCFPVLAGPPGTTDLMLVSPIILYDHPEIAEQSCGALYDATEIDEILTLRVMTMTDEEKAQARATDPRAARIIDQCDGMTPEAMLNLHGVLRDPHAGAPGLIPPVPDGVDWWDPLADAAVTPDADAVVVRGIRVSRGSRVRLHPGRNADAQDMFVAGRTARVASVHEDVEGRCHIGVVLDDDPAADLHDAYGRYLYFSPDEVEPLGAKERSPT